MTQRGSVITIVRLSITQLDGGDIVYQASLFVPLKFQSSYHDVVIEKLNVCQRNCNVKVLSCFKHYKHFASVRKHGACTDSTIDKTALSATNIPDTRRRRTTRNAFYQREIEKKNK